MNVMMGLIGFISRIKVKPVEHQLSTIEKQTLFPELEDDKLKIEGKKLDQFTSFHLGLAQQNGELNSSGDHEEIIVYLLTLFYGTAFSLFTLSKGDLKINRKGNFTETFRHNRK